MHFKSIPLLLVAGIQKDNTSLYVTDTRYLPLTSKEGDTIIIECMYAASANYTLVSPSSITRQYDDIYTSWKLHSNTWEKYGYLQLVCEDGVNHTTFPIYIEGKLLYHYATERPTAVFLLNSKSYNGETITLVIWFRFRFGLVWD